ncbi:docking protein 2 isoform X2 [Peromyscus leucopus]|uniref:docking protein 2 isoform X2 n=1 Tax=Peromyscus leucopus TaxID=10041 RepID=UPI00188558E1|nr:docking protein 2 isoform X2 [Peromyscus leucopus]
MCTSISPHPVLLPHPLLLAHGPSSPLNNRLSTSGDSLSASACHAWAQKWRRFTAVLYGESGCALARLELQDGPEKTRRGEATRKVVRLSDCLRVAEAGSEASSPRDTSAFILETKERLYLLAAPSAERSDWIQAICLLAFPRKEPSGLEEKNDRPCMEENELYSSSTTGVTRKEYAVTMRPTEASERCRLRGSYTLRVGVSALELWGGPEPGTQLYDWPYRFLRRFGRDKVTFSFEAGRRCVSGEGSFEFETRQGNEIFQALEEAIAAQKNAAPSGPPTLPATGPMMAAVLPRPESPYSRPHDSLPSPSPGTPVPGVRPGGPEGEYAVPFDTVALSLGKSFRGILKGPPRLLPDPLYDSIQEGPVAPPPDHIYDEPEGVAALSLYDRPRELQGETWREQATADGGPNPRQQDSSVPGWPQATEYDNVILKKGPNFIYSLLLTEKPLCDTQLNYAVASGQVRGPPPLRECPSCLCVLGVICRNLPPAYSGVSQEVPRWTFSISEGPRLLRPLWLP